MTDTTPIVLVAILWCRGSSTPMRTFDRPELNVVIFAFLPNFV